MDYISLYQSEFGYRLKVIASDIFFRKINVKLRWVIP